MQQPRPSLDLGGQTLVSIRQGHGFYAYERGQEPLSPDISTSWCHEHHGSSLLLPPHRLPGRLVALTMQFRRLTPGYFRILQVSTPNLQFWARTPSSPYHGWVVSSNGQGTLSRSLPPEQPGPRWAPKREGLGWNLPGAAMAAISPSRGCTFSSQHLPLLEVSIDPSGGPSVHP